MVHSQVAISDPLDEAVDLSPFAIGLIAQMYEAFTTPTAGLAFLPALLPPELAEMEPGPELGKMLIPLES